MRNIRRNPFAVGVLVASMVAFYSLFGVSSVAYAASTTVMDKTELTTALGNATGEEEVVLGDDINAPTTRFDVDGTHTLDLAGYTLTTRYLRLADGAHLTITDTGNGGELIAGPDSHAAGILMTDAELTIESGAVTATGQGYGAGIGGSAQGDGGIVTINGGTVTATGGSSGAGIGGGYNGGGGTVTINGGTVTATGGKSGAGIGGGGSSTILDGDGVGGTTTINGGNVTATGGERGAAIGGGYNGAGGTTAIGSNATVTVATNGSPNGVIGAGEGGSGFGSLTVGGTLIVSPGSELVIPGAETVSGDGFAGGSGEIVNNGVITTTADPVSSGWTVTEHNFAVTFDSGYSGGADQTTHIYATTMAEGGRTLATPTRAGFAFTEWNTESDGSGTAFSSDTDLTDDTTVYAQWTDATTDPGDVTVTKTVDASFVRVFDWDLAKSGQVGEVTVDGDTASADVDYTVTATPQGARNADYKLSGEITVKNTFVEPVTFTVTDEPDVGVDATCDVYDSDGNLAEDVRLGAEESATFDYSCSLEGIPEDGTNTAVVTNENGDGQSRVEEAVVFEERDTSFDTVNIDDDKTTPENGFVDLGEAEWNADGIPAVFDYTLTQSDLPVGECTSFTNTAMIAQTEQSAQATVEICPEPATDPDVPAAAQTGGLAKTGSDVTGPVGAALLLIVAGGAAILIRRKVKN